MSNLKKDLREYKDLTVSSVEEFILDLASKEGDNKIVTFITGKEGYIDFEIAMMEAINAPEKEIEERRLLLEQTTLDGFYVFTNGILVDSPLMNNSK